MQILLAEKCNRIIQNIGSKLSIHSKNVKNVKDIASVCNQLKRENFDNLILSHRIIQSSTTEIINVIFKNFNYTPIIYIAAEKKLESGIDALKAGADDFIIEPLNVDELVARIRALERFNNKKYL